MKKYRQLAKEIVPTKSLLTVLTPTKSGNKHLIESIISDPLLARKTDHPAPHIPKTISETISEAVLIEVAPPSAPQPPVAFAPVSMPQETPAPVVPVSTDNMNKYLTDKSFQQPNPDPVPQEMDAVTAKLKFLEQAIGRIAAHGPGSGEVNLRYLDDVDRPSIIDGKFLKYNGTTKKFDFADPTPGGVGIAQVNSDWDAVSGVAEILNKPTIPDVQVNSDWDAVSGVAEILNKPTLFGGSYSDLTNMPTIYGYEIHVSQISGNDTTGNGTLLSPVASITKALTLVDANNRIIIVHPGSYYENPTITNVYTLITTFHSHGATAEIVGTLTIACPCTVSGLILRTVDITSSTGSGSVYLINSSVKTSLTKSGSQAYTEINNCEIQAPYGSIITGPGTINADGNKNFFITVNNAAAIVSVKNCTQVLAPSVLAGALYLNDCVVFSATNTSNGITSGAGTILNITNCQVITPVGGSARISAAGYYSIDNIQYDKANSTLTGINLNTISHFQGINTDSVRSTGDLTLGNDNQYIKIAKNDGDITISTNGNTENWVFGNNGTLTMPFGSLFTETSTTLILTPPGAFPGQGLVISPTTGTGLTSDVAFAAGATITVRLTDAGSHTHEDLTGSGGRDGSWPYTITGATAYQLGLAGLSGTFLATDWVLFGGNYVNDIVINVPIGTTATGFIVTLDDQVGPPYTGFPVPTTITTTVGSIVTPSESSHIHILSGDQTNVDLFLGNDNQYVKIGKNNGDVVIGTNGNTHNWIFSADSTTTVPSGLYLPTGNLTETIASVEVIIDDLVLDMIVDYSTGEGDNIPADTYGTHIQINHPWAIYQFTTDPAPALAVEDIIAGQAVPAFSQVLVVGTGIYTKIAVTDKTIVDTLPAHNAVITITRPITLATLSLNTAADTNISLLPTGLGNVLFESDLIPITSGAHSLGTPTRRFKQLWLSGGSIYLQDETTGADLRVTAIDGDFVIAGGAGLRVGEFRFHDNQLFINNPDRDIIIGTADATADVVFNRPIRVNTPFGIDSFSVQRDGHVEFRPPQIPAGDIGALAIIGTADSSYQPVINAGGMLHITAYDGDPARITMDTFGIGNVPIFIGRKARGIAATPTPTQTGDILARFAGLGYAIPNYFPTGATLPSSIEFTATDNYSDTLFGSKATIYTYKQGTTTRTESLNIDSTNITLPVNSGITFGDTTRQTTAGITSVSIGDGLTGSVVDGALTIDATGVQSVTAAVGDGEIAITSDLSGRNLTLTLPQPLGITSTPEFLSLTLQDLTVNGTYTVAINTTVASKILYLASDATLAAQIDGGGVVLGTGAFARSITYDLTPDRWDTDGAGLKTENLEAIDGLFTGVLESRGHAMFGTGYIGTDYPNTTIQSDTNINDFGYVVNINHNGGTNASSDFRAVNDIGTASTHFIDMGINSSTFANPAQSITGTNDGYLYVNGGDLIIGTESAGANILMHTGGNTIDKLRGTWSDTGLNVVGSVTAASFHGPLTGNVTGNADTVTNGVYTNGSYANPTWITSLAYSKLTGTPTIPAAQIQSDWTQSNNALLDYIKNKPTIPAAQVNSDWNAVSGVAEILNKPTIPASQLVYVVNSAVTMSTGTGVQNLFGLANGVTLASNTRYIYRMMFTLAKTGSNNPNLQYSLGLGADTVLAKHAYSVQSNSNTTRTGTAAGITMMTNDITTGFSTGVSISNMSGGTSWQAFVFEGIIDVTTGGNVSFRLQGDESVTTLSMLSLGMITLMPVGVIGANTAAGTWS